MKLLRPYDLTALLVVTIAAAAAWPFLDPAGRISLAIAGGVAWTYQIAAHGALVRSASHPRAFLACWGGGILGRLALVASLGLAGPRIGSLDATVLVVGGSGLLFGLLLLETAFFARERNEGRPAR